MKLLETRKLRQLPDHSPPHLEGGADFYHICSACYEHQNLIGMKNERIEEFTKELIALCQAHGELHAWCILPNHYHLLIKTDNLKSFTRIHGNFHGNKSYQFNSEDQTRGRKCFFNQSDRFIRSFRHYWVTMNYIHNNPVHHKYVKNWTDWPYSSAQQFLKIYGRKKAKEIWYEYPLKNYGEKWDVF